MIKLKRKEKGNRSIEDILTPKDMDIKGEEMEENISNNEECEKEVENPTEKRVETECKNERNAEVEEKSAPKDIKVETPEEVSFNALTCFGWSETKTPKWLIKCAHFWYGAMSFFWFIFGALTFAPIIFMQKKINVIFKDKLRSFAVASIIYVAFLALLVVAFVTRNQDKVTEIARNANSMVRF